MDLHRHPQLLDQLAAAHALGLLRGGARRRFEALAQQHAAVRAAALDWQHRVAGLNEVQPETDVPAAVWTRINNMRSAERAQHAMTAARGAPAARGGWWNSLGWWRGAAGAGAVATAAVLVTTLALNQRMDTQIDDLRASLQKQPQVGYVAVLSDEQSRASMLITVDPRRGQLVLQRVGDYREAADKSLQLWALPADGAPRSLGVLTRNGQAKLPLDANALQAVPALAISLEPLGGVPSAGGPTGPVLFKGALIHKTT